MGNTQRIKSESGPEKTYKIKHTKNPKLKPLFQEAENLIQEYVTISQLVDQALKNPMNDNLARIRKDTAYFSLLEKAPKRLLEIESALTRIEDEVNAIAPNTKKKAICSNLKMIKICKSKLKYMSEWASIVYEDIRFFNVIKKTLDSSGLQT